jgi:hypothetical protein
MADIKVNLSGITLQAQIKYCSDKPDKCPLTNNYPNTLATNQKLVDTAEQVTDSILKQVLKNTIYPTVPQKIDTNIYKPVTECLKKM